MAEETMKAFDLTKVDGSDIMTQPFSLSDTDPIISEKKSNVMTGDEFSKLGKISSSWNYPAWKKTTASEVFGTEKVDLTKPEEFIASTSQGFIDEIANFPDKIKNETAQIVMEGYQDKNKLTQRLIGYISNILPKLPVGTQPDELVKKIVDKSDVFKPEYDEKLVNTLDGREYPLVEWARKTLSNTTKAIQDRDLARVLQAEQRGIDRDAWSNQIGTTIGAMMPVIALGKGVGGISKALGATAETASKVGATAMKAGTLAQMTGDYAYTTAAQYLDKTGDSDFTNFTPEDAKGLSALGYGAIGTMIEYGFGGVEPLFASGMEKLGTSNILKAVGKTMAGEAWEEFLQEWEEFLFRNADGTNTRTWGETLKYSLKSAVYGGLIGGVVGDVAYRTNRRNIANALMKTGMDYGTAIKIADTVIEDTGQEIFKRADENLSLTNKVGESFSKLQGNIKVALETAGWSDNIIDPTTQQPMDIDTYSNIMAADISSQIVRQASLSGLSPNEFMDASQFQAIDNVVYLKPLGTKADIKSQIDAQDFIIKRQRELKKTGAEDSEKLKLAQMRKNILKKAYDIKEYQEKRAKERIKAQTTPKTAKEIETATKDVETVKGTTQAEFDSKVDTQNLTSAEKSKRYGNAVLKSILPTKTDFDAVMVDPMYANAKQAIIAVADRINSFIKAHRTYGLKGDIANALKRMQTINQGNFIDSVSTPDLTGNDVIAENAFLYHFLFSDANTIQAYLNAYITRAEQSLNGEIKELSKKDLVGQSLKATDETMQAQAKILGTEYQSIYDESGKTFIDKNVMAVWESGQHQFISEPVQLTLFQQDNLTERENGPKIVSDDTTVEVIELSKDDLPQNLKMSDFVKWVIRVLGDSKNIHIKSSNQDVLVSTESVRRANIKTNPVSKSVFSKLKAVIENAYYSGFRQADEKHPNVKGQDIYHNALIIDGKPYSVKIMVDIPKKSTNPNVYAGHTISEIEIEPATRDGQQDASQTPIGKSPITSISLGVLRGKVKPARYKNGVLAQSRVANGSYDPELGVIILGRNMNEMTLPHEMQHYWLDKIFSIYKRAKSGELKVRDEWMTETKALFDMLGIDENQTQLTQGQQEKFARMSEAYLTGIGVTGDMNATFKEYQQWVPEKYKSILNLGYLSDDGKIEYPFLDQGAVDFFNKWYANYSLPSLATSPERQEFVNPEDENGEVLPVSIKEMNNRDKEFGNDAEEQVKTDQRLYNTLDENMPAEIKIEADGQKVVQASRSNFLKESEKQQRRWFERKSRDAEAQMAQDYIEKNPEHAKEVIFGDPELIPNDTGIDRATLINAYMALNNITPESEDWATLHTNIAINQSLAGTQLALSNNTSYRTYLDALREIENAREMKAATNYAGAKQGAVERFNRDIQRFVDEELPKVLATAPNTEARDIALKSLFERARTKFSGNTTGGVLNQMDFDYARGQKGASAAFTRWAVNQIKKDAGAKLNGQEQAHLLNLSAKAQQAVIDLDDRDVGKAVAGAQEIRKWQVEKDKLMGVKPQKFSLLGDYAPRAMLASFNTLVVSNIPSTAMNTAVVRMLESGIFGKNEVSTSLTDSEIKRIKAIYGATAMNLAQMERPTSPSLLHGEKYSSSGQKWYDPFTILGKEDNWFRVPTFVNTLARIATQDAKATGKSADEVFKEYCRLENQSDEARLARKQALAVANMAVFTQDGALARSLNEIRSWINKGSRALIGLDPNGFGLGNLLSPFLKTGANIAEMGIRGSLAPVTTIAALAQKWRSGKAIDPMKKLALGMDWTYFALSSVTVALLAALTSDDDDFYTEPYEMGKKYDPDKPYDSINIAGVWIDLDFFGPFAIPIRTGCRLIKQWKTDNLSAIYKGYGQGLKYAAMDTPLLQEIFNNQMSYASKKPEDWATGALYNQANKLVPAQIKPLSRAISRGTETQLDIGWSGKIIERKFHRNYGFDGAELTTQDLIDIFTTRITWQP